MQRKRVPIIRPLAALGRGKGDAGRKDGKET